MTDIQAIQEEIIADYTAITLPVLGTPTSYKHEPKDGFSSVDLPAIVVTRGIQISSVPSSGESNLVTREFITDLFAYVTDENDPVKATIRDNTADCIPVILGAFPLYGLQTTGVLSHRITADTADVELNARDTVKDYIGVRFRHEIVYHQST